MRCGLWQGCRRSVVKPPVRFSHRGFVYCRNEELEPGWLAFGSGSLLHRPVSFDNKPHSLFQVIDQNTLQVNRKP